MNTACLAALLRLTLLASGCRQLGVFLKWEIVQLFRILAQFQFCKIKIQSKEFQFKTKACVLPKASASGSLTA